MKRCTGFIAGHIVRAHQTIARQVQQRNIQFQRKSCRVSEIVPETMATIAHSPVEAPNRHQP